MGRRSNLGKRSETLQGEVVKLEPLTPESAELARQWRNEDISPYRTPFLLTSENQQEWYKEVTERCSPHRYYTIGDKSLRDSNYWINGVGGITNIQWENRICEISLVINPKNRRMGIGSEAVQLIKYEAFNSLNLHTLFGEVYGCANMDFWKSCKPDYMTTLPNRKYWNGKYHDSMYFSWSKDGDN